MEIKENETLDIVKLIEKNPITRLSKEYQSKMIEKIKEKFTQKEQQMFVASFFCYLNYEKDKFIIDFDDVWKWAGFTRKDNSKRMLEKYFVENIDYKISIKNNKNAQGGRPEEQILLTVNTFKKFCLKANTKKSDEIHDYYIKLVDLLHETLNEESSDLRNQLLLKDAKHHRELKMKRHDTLVQIFRSKRCVYIGEIEENKFIKIGSSKEVDCRARSLNNEYAGVIFLEVFECENFRDVESKILEDTVVAKNLYKGAIKANGKTSREVVELTKDFTYDKLISIVKKCVEKFRYQPLSHEQLLEKQRMDNEMEIENKKINNNFLLSLLNSDKDMKQKIIQSIMPNLIENMLNTDMINANMFIESMMEANKEKIEEHFKKEIADKMDHEVKNCVNNIVTDEVKEIMHEVEIKKSINPNNNIVLDVQRNVRQPKGRKIQKIDPGNLNNIIKVYESISYLLRSPENQELKKPCLEKALKANTIYKGYRWCFVDSDKDPHVSQAKPTVEAKMIQSSEIVIQLNDEKNKILNSFSTKREMAKKLGISLSKTYKIINEEMKFENSYFVMYSKCPQDLLKTYNKSTTRVVQAKNSLGPIKQINPITKEEIIFNTFDEINIKLGFRRPTIKKAIENKLLHGGSLWQYCEKKV
jgi:phage anti-repressor protein